MADQVSRMASGGLSASFMRLLMNFLESIAASGLQDERNKIDMCVYICQI